MRVHQLATILTALMLAVVALCGCSRADRYPHLLTVLDLTPTDVDVGDRLEIIGIDFPEGKPAEITFQGDLLRPGQPPEKNVSIRVEAVSSSSSRIDFTMTQGLQDRFAGAGDKAVHTTFRGDVLVSFAGARDRVDGLIKNVKLDVHAPSARRAVIEARERQGRAALAYLGLDVGPDSPTAGGLRVKAVDPSAKGYNPRVQPGDVIVSFAGVEVDTLADVIPAGAGKYTLEVRHAGTAHTDPVLVDMTGYEGGPPADLLGAGIVLLVALLIIGVFMAPTAGIITWVERRVAARMQSRIGPNRTGPQGFLQWVADGIKSLLKEDIIPAECDKPLFRLAPYLVFVGVSATFVVMPFGQYLVAADLDIGILFVVAVTSLVAIGLMTGGWASNNKWSMLGGIRSAAQIISYEIPAAVSIVCIVMMTGSLRLQDIIRAQGGMPWEWYMFENPVTFLLFFLYFTTALAEGNRAPFDLPEAESELVAGYSTEYSGMRYVFFFFAEWANVFVMSGIVSALFLGGWQVPGVDAGTQAASFWLQALGAFIFLTKAWILIFVVVWVRWTLPRIRIDQMMNLCWKWFVPGSFVAFVLTALWLVWNPSELIRTIVALATFGVFVLLLVQFGRRVVYNLRSMQARVHVNPFI